MNALEIKHLTKSIPGFSLGPINLTLPGGCVMGLIGENGAGKSTTIKLILDMIHKDAGTISILGRDHRDKSGSIKEQIGVVPDEIGLPPALDAEYIGRIMRGIFRTWNDERYASLLRQLSLPTEKEFKDFSHGMKTKLGIAIALSHDSKLLLLDETISGIDPVVRDEIVQMLNDYTREKTHSILISSQIVSDIERLCDYVAFLHRGRLLLCEEKDRLPDRYGMVHCTHAQLDALDADAILSQKETAYGVEAILSRDAIPKEMEACPIGMEQLFLCMVKEASL